MKKLLPIFAISFLLLCGCTTINDGCKTGDCQSNNKGPEIQTNEVDTNGYRININNVLKGIVMEQNQCGDDSQLFVDIALLGNSTKENGNKEYYIVTNGQGFYVDERGNLNNSCGFGGIPTTIELSLEENGGYHLEHYETAKDGSEYDSSTKEMFSEQAYKIRKDAKYVYINDKTLLEQAEEYFNTKIIPEGDNNFECKFCDKLRFYEQNPEADEELQETNELHFDYVAQDNGKNTIYFGSDGTFEAKGSRDAGKGTRVFGQDENTVIVSNENLNHVYDRYIITNVDENNLNTILEIIQRR